jgi:hypothetical protein
MLSTAEALTAIPKEPTDKRAPVVRGSVVTPGQVERFLDREPPPAKGGSRPIDRSREGVAATVTRKRRLNQPTLISLGGS